jgi:hypothetical protein
MPGVLMLMQKTNPIMKNQILKETAALIADKLTVKGWVLNMFKRPIIEQALIQGHAFIDSKSPLVADHFIELCEAYITADKNHIIDDTADLLAAIVKQLFYPQIIVRVKK